MCDEVEALKGNSGAEVFRSGVTRIDLDTKC